MGTRIGGRRRVRISLFCCIGMLCMWMAPRVSAQTTWSTATSGDWDADGNWSSLAPNGNVANLTAVGGSYTVTYGTPSPSFTDLNVINAGTDTTTLNIGADGFKSSDGILTIGLGASVNVNAGGTMYYDGADSTKTIAVIKDGGVWHVNGGSVLFTNLYPGVSLTAKTKTISIGPAGSQGTLKVSSGDLRLISSYAGNNNRLAIQVGHGSGGSGLFEMTGGSAVTVASTGFLVGCVNGSYGQLRMSGGSSLILTNGLWVGNSGGTGVVSLADNAYLEQVPISLRTAIGGSAGSLGTISVSNNATLNLGSSGSYTCLGGQMTTTGGGTGIVSFADSATGSFNILYVGMSAQAGARGYGELTMSGGQVGIINAFSVGYTRAATGSGYGIVNLSGGTLALLGNNGISLGTRDATAIGAVPANRGALNLSGNGLVTTTTSQIFIGALSDCVGTVNQTGGSFIINHTTTARPMIIGRAGGEGTYRISQGVFSSRSWVLVGGATGDGGSGSQGLLEVTGGSFSVTNTLYVGQNGTGTVSIAGGELSASSLDLASGDATLRFGFASGATGNCTITGAMTIHADAKLEIDIANATPGVKYTLVTCGSRATSFAPANISVPGGQRSWVDQDTDQNIYFRMPSGSLIYLR